MNKKLIMLLLLLVMAVSCPAAERTETELRLTALGRLAMASGGQHPAILGATALKCTLRNGMVAVYAAEGVGSVLMSTDDMFRPVLGYTSAVITDSMELPCGMRWWLEEMNTQMQTAKSSAAGTDLAMMDKTASAGYTAVDELVTTKWGQNAPYNTFTPELNGENAPTGCVATALAQILNYNRWPESAEFIGSYSIDWGETYTDAEVRNSYSYPYKTAYGYYSVDGTMTNIAKEDYTILDQKKIGWLMRDCGYASLMMYDTEGSGAYIMDAAIGALDFLSYPVEAVKYADRTYYSDDEWHDLVYNEIENGYPVLYGGTDKSLGGHAFVVHGIDADGLVAVNWGWQGLCDGYFAMDAMESGEGTFSYSQEMLYGMHPTVLSGDKAESLWAGDYSLTGGSGGTENIMLQVRGLYNFTLTDFTGTVALCFEDYDGRNVDGIIIVNAEDGVFSPLYGFYLKEQLCIDEYLDEILKKGHTYKVYMASRDEEEEQEDVWMMARVEGGRKYYVITVDTYGSPSITANGFDTTSIDNVREDVSGENSDRVYNISGQSVGGSYRGIVIKDGKKILR